MRRTQAWPAAAQQRLHRAMYLSLQALRGRPLHRQMRLLRQWEKLTPDAYDQLCRQRREAQLAEVKHRFAFYRHGPWAKARADDLQSWPVLERPAVQDHIDALTQPMPRMVHRRSSASTARPLRVAWDAPGASWSWAVEYVALGWHGVDIASRTIMLWAFEQPFANWVLNRRYFNTMTFTVENLDRAAEAIMRDQPRLLWSMPSAAAQLARHVGRRYGPATSPRIGFAKIGGEQVYAFQRREIERNLGARVLQVYGCSEMGVLAFECPEGSLHLFNPLVHVEVMRGDRVAPPGEFGELVMTSLVNRAMPLIRYRNGDCGRVSPEPCRCGRPMPVLAELQGRTCDTFSTADGRVVHGSAIGAAFEDHVGRPGLGAARQVLFEQRDPTHWIITLERDEPVDRLLEAQVCELVRSLFGRACQTEIRTVAFLPREPSGKFRYYRPPSAGARASAVAPAASMNRGILPLQEAGA